MWSLTFFLLILFIFLNSAFCEAPVILPDKDGILCRMCGNYITSARNLISVESDAALGRRYINALGDHQVLIQLVSPYFNSHVDPEIAVFNQSGCTTTSDWRNENTWFTGYKWRRCSCPNCETIIGRCRVIGNNSEVDILSGEVIHYIMTDTVVKCDGITVVDTAPSVSSLNEDQIELLKSLEEEFADRFTDKDPEYQAVAQEVKEPKGPPIKYLLPSNQNRGRFDRRPRGNEERNERQEYSREKYGSRKRSGDRDNQGYRTYQQNDEGSRSKYQRDNGRDRHEQRRYSNNSNYGRHRYYGNDFNDNRRYESAQGTSRNNCSYRNEYSSNNYKRPCHEYSTTDCSSSNEPGFLPNVPKDQYQVPEQKDNKGEAKLSDAVCS